MANIHIKRISEHTYTVRQYDEVMSVGIGEMSEEKLHTHLEAQHLLDYTASEVFEALNVDGEITVRFRAMF